MLPMEPSSFAPTPSAKVSLPSPHCQSVSKWDGHEAPYPLIAIDHIHDGLVGAHIFAKELVMHKANRTVFLAAAFLTASTWASSVGAAKPVAAPPPACSEVTFSVTTLSCLGFFQGNLVAESGPKLTTALDLTSTLDGGATTLLEKIDWGSNQVAGLIDFSKSISGKTVIGIHFGGGNTGYNGTAFWLLDAPAGTDKITWYSARQKGISNAGLYLTQPAPAVPEPTTWALLLLGFAAVGAAMRGSRQNRYLFNRCAIR